MVQTAIRMHPINAIRLWRYQPLEFTDTQVANHLTDPQSSVSDIPTWRGLAQEALMGGPALRDLRRYSVVRSIVDTVD